MTCPTCGRDFEQRRPNHRYCDDVCRRGASDKLRGRPVRGRIGVPYFRRGLTPEQIECRLANGLRV